MQCQTRFADHVRGWLIAGGLGLLAGYLVGLGGMGTYSHVKWPALAGIVIGVASSIAVPTHQILVALCGAVVTVVAAVVTIVSIQFQQGRWPMTDAFTVAHYGSTTPATMRAAVMLGVLVGVPCLSAAILVAVAKRRCGLAAHQAAPADAVSPRR